MSKKKKKKKPVSPEVKAKRRIKKYMRRTLILALLVLGYFWLLPIIAPSYAPQVEKTKETVLTAASQAQSQATQILGTATQLTTELTSGKDALEGKDPEEMVQNAVDDLKERVKALPGEQVKKVKRQFCADVIEEAKNNNEPSETENQD